MQTVYKVVQQVDDEYYSAIITGQYSCKYELHKWTVSKLGQLFAFDDLDGALRFKHELEATYKAGLQVLKCEAIGVHDTGHLVLLYGRRSQTLIKKFWTEGLNNHVGTIAEGTVLCDKLRPIQKL